MGLSAAQLRHDLDALASAHAPVAAALEAFGYPEPRIRPRGHLTLLRTIVGQQVSVMAANSMWAKFVGLVGDPGDPQRLLALSPEELRTAGLSRQKSAYMLGLAQAMVEGRIDFAALPADDEEAILTLSSLKGIGRWSAEIYLLFSEGRGDIFPAGDLAVQAEMARMLALPERPAEKAARALAEGWRPYRGAAAILLWHGYNTSVV